MKMASIKMLCIVFVLTLFGEIRANVDSDALVAPKHVPVHQVLPPSLLYLLHSRPIGRSQPSPVAKPPSFPQYRASNVFPRYPTAPIPPTLPVAPTAPELPTPPIAPTAPVPPTPPVSPVLPTIPRAPSSGSGSSSGKHVSVHQMLPPSILYLLNHRPIRRPLPSKPVRPEPLTSQSNPPVAPVPAVLPNPINPRVPQTQNPSPLPPGQLSYDNPSNGNRKLLNVVHVPLRPVDNKPNGLTVVGPSLGPAPLPAVVPNSSQGEDLSPVPTDTTGVLPIPAKPESDQEESSNSANTITINPKDLPVQPSNSVEVSPIPVRSNNVIKPEDLSPSPNDAEEASPVPSKSDSTNTITINPKDIPVLPPNSIEVSPIPVRSNKYVINPEDLSLSPNDAAEASSVPSQSDSKNTITLNPKDLPLQPPYSIEVSPIPVKSNVKPEDLSLSPKEEQSSVPADTQGESTSSDESKPSEEKSSSPQNTISFNPNEIPFQPIDDIAASPIPVRPNSGDVQNPLANVLLNDSPSGKDSKNTITLNPKDLPVQPPNSIEVSPIPVRSNVKPEDLSLSPKEEQPSVPADTQGESTSSDESKPSEEKSSSSQNTTSFNPNEIPFQPIDNIAASPIPVRPNSGDVQNPLANVLLNGSPSGKDSKNTITLNPKDLPVQPPNSIEVSPIPVRSNVKPEDLSLSPKEKKPSVPADTQGESTSSDESKPSEEKSSSPQNTTSFNPNEIPFQPIDNIAASPIPVRPNSGDVQNPLANVLLNGTSSSTPSEPSQNNPLKDVVLNGTSSNTPTEPPQDNPLKDVVLNGGSTSTSTEQPQDNPLKNVVLNGTSSNPATEQPQENPLKDLIVNDTAAKKSDQDKNDSAEETSDEDQSKSSQEKNEESNNGSSQNSASNKEENSEVSSSNSSDSAGSKESSNVSAEELDSSQTE